MAEEESKTHGIPDETARPYRRAGVSGAILFLVSVLYLFISTAISAGPTFLDLAMQLGFVASYILLLIGVMGMTHAGPASAFVALISNSYVLVSALQFFWIPKGAEIRPMGWAAFVCLISLVCFVTVAVLAVRGIRKDHTYRWSLLALPLGICPLFVGSGVLNLAAWVKGFTLLP